MKKHIVKWLGILLLSGGGVSCADHLPGEWADDRGEEERCSPFLRAAEDPVSLPDFRLTYGVGFSYDAIYGERCQLKDVRSQVLDYTGLTDWDKAWNGSLLRLSRRNDVSVSCAMAYSRSEYLQKSVLYADAEGKMIVFKGDASAALTMAESGGENDFFCSARFDNRLLQVTLDDVSLSALIQEEGHHELLTKNFREVVKWMQTHHDELTIDSFLMRYGTHVVTKADLGGSISLNMRMKRDSLVDVMDNTVLTDADLLSIYTSSTAEQAQRRVLHQLNSADCSVTIKGGDLSKIPNDILHFRFGDRPDLSTYVKDWSGSLVYDTDDWLKSNLEMTDMEVRPIWHFIPDEELAQRVERYVTGKVESILSQAADASAGVTTWFRLPQTVTCRMGGQPSTFQHPATVNIIAAGRYVATVCRERIEGIDPAEDVQVVYPIYNRKANLNSGWCMHGGKTYRVNWHRGVCKVTPQEAICTGDTVYLIYGVPGCTRYAGEYYVDSHPVIGYEWPMSIRQDGTLDTTRPYYLVYKQDGQFLLRDTAGQEQQGRLEGLPNWTFTEGRMVRGADYAYDWNATEVGYE